MTWKSWRNFLYTVGGAAKSVVSAVGADLILPEPLDNLG